MQVTDKLYHIMLYTSPWAGFKLATLVVMGTVSLGTSTCTDKNVYKFNKILILSFYLESLKVKQKLTAYLATTEIVGRQTLNPTIF